MENLISKLALILKVIANDSWRVISFTPKSTLKFNLLAMAMLTYPGLTVTANETLADEVKAAYLYKFSAYVDWPSGAFATLSSPFVLCILGGNAHFKATLNKVVQGEHVNGRAIEVHEINSLEKHSGCHILYIETNDTLQSTALINTVRGSHVLTVTDHATQGIIGFTISNNRMRFNIDDAAAAENGLTISSRLLKLAVNVNKRG